MDSIQDALVEAFLAAAGQPGTGGLASFVAEIVRNAAGIEMSAGTPVVRSGVPDLATPTAGTNPVATPALQPGASAEASAGNVEGQAPADSNAPATVSAQATDAAPGPPASTASEGSSSGAAAVSDAAGSSALASVISLAIEEVRTAQSRAAVATMATGSSTGNGFLGVIDSLFSNTGGASGLAEQILHGAVSSSGGSGGGVLDTLGSIASSVLKSGLGMMPLVSGILSLFGGGGGGTEKPPPLVKYALPSAIEFAAAETGGGGFSGVDYGQSGQARGWNDGGRQAGSPQIVVQAMDARSFMERSGEIAAAVRDAMLNLNSINDVVNDL